jgi:hypothetical protein
MTEKVERQTGRFQAVSDDGRAVMVNILTTFLISRPLSGPPQEIEGLRRLLTDDGLSVNRLGKGEYQIVATGVKLRSDDPDAP